ncbi:hypothetical protein GE061_003924 [Apolygus lucorum]|uniref:p53 DNA-binding domain-containing protein n=1 Tax=Apolygus lucorum TaxID=248454 RepID=A0A8S9WXX3_APOLU|nr:hypothetical protein GE061_003924 [Apolygus lucorum]
MESTVLVEEIEEEFIDDSGFPVELNQLKTAELLHAVQNYPGLAGYLTDDQYDPMGPEDANNMIVENYVANSVLIQQHSPSELPNSTVPSAPLPTGTHPCLEDFEGEYGFTISQEALNATGTSHSWSYSETLKQVFIKMNNVLMVQFKTDKPLGLEGEQFFIRALLVYQNNDFVSQAVNRCSIH